MTSESQTGICCAWCEAPIPVPSRRGSPQRFCSPKCRAAFHRACERYTCALVADGYLTAPDLRNWAEKSVYAFRETFESAFMTD